MTIPANIDYVGVLDDLNRWGWSDYKIELALGFSKFYVGHLRRGRYDDMGYRRAAQLYNLWYDEANKRGVCIPWDVFALAENSRQLVAST